TLDDIVDNYRVIVLTESQCAQADGTLRDAGTQDTDAEAFCREFADAQARSPSADFLALENEFRLHALLLAARFRQDPARVGLALSPLIRDWHLRSPCKSVSSMPGLANVVVQRTETDSAVQVRAILVCGGVSMQAHLGPDQFTRSQTIAESLTRKREHI